MALVLKDRVKVTTTTTGTGTLTLGAASQGFQDFSVIGDGNSTYYTIQDPTTGAWEVGVGVYTASGTTLSRNVVLSSSNSGSLVDFAAGSKAVFVTYPAEKAVVTDGTQTLTNKTISADSNTISGIAASSFVLSNGSGNIDGTAAQKAIPTGDVVGTTDTQTLTNKTLSGASNTITNLPLSTAVTGTLPVANGGTGITSFGSGIATFLGTPSSANLASAVTDETGSGALVFATSPTLVTPVLGTPTSGTLSNCTVDGTNAVGFRILPQNSQSAAYTLVADDSGKHILHPSADTTARTFTIPSNGSVPYPIGTAITFVNQNGAGVITIAITTDTMRLAGAGTTGSRTLAANGVATAIKVTSTEWIISGTGLT